MKLLVSLWVLCAVADAGFIGHGDSGGHHRNSHDRGHGGSAKVYKVKVINGGHGGSYGPDHSHGHHHGHDSEPKIIKVIHQQSSDFSNSGHGSHGGYGPANDPKIIKIIHHHSSQGSHSAAPQVIKLIHQQGGSAGASSIGATLGPVSVPAQVIKVIHENGAGNAGSGSAIQHQFSNPDKVIRVVHEHSQYESAGSIGSGVVAAPENSYLPPVQAAGSATHAQVSAPAKVIRVIHEQAPAQSGIQAASFPSAAAIAPDSNYLPPVQTPAQNFNSQVPQYSAPSQNIAVSNQYLPPLPPQTFTAPEPVPAASHLPAQSYGPPSQ